MQEVPKKMSKNNDGIGFLIGLLAGTAIGVSVGMILAPRSGQESRRMLNDKFETYRRKAAEAADELRANTSEAIAKGKRYCDSVREHYAQAKAERTAALSQPESAEITQPLDEKDMQDFEDFAAIQGQNPQQA